jgi:hypothetical protein
MRIFLSILSFVALFLAARRFYLSENVGYDIGALFLLLIGIQLFVAAVLVHEHQQARRPKPPPPADFDESKDADPHGKQ